jgi:hypothetical protein
MMTERRKKTPTQGAAETGRQTGRGTPHAIRGRATAGPELALLEAWQTRVGNAAQKILEGEPGLSRTDLATRVAAALEWPKTLKPPGKAALAQRRTTVARALDDLGLAQTEPTAQPVERDRREELQRSQVADLEARVEMRARMIRAYGGKDGGRRRITIERARKLAQQQIEREIAAEAKRRAMPEVTSPAS